MQLREKLFVELYAGFDEAYQKIAHKDVNYSKGDDPFAAFRMTAMNTELSVEKVIEVKLFDSLALYQNCLAKSGDPEVLNKALVDAMNYIATLKVWHQLEKPEADATYNDETGELVTTEPGPVAEEEVPVVVNQEPTPMPTPVEEVNPRGLNLDSYKKALVGMGA